MEKLPHIRFKNLKPHIADAIKEACYKQDVRIYNIANEVHNIPTYTNEPGVEIAEGLVKITDKTIKDAVMIGCDLAVISKGLLVGAFRASPYVAQEAHKTIHILIKEILQAVSKYKGNVKKTVEGIVVAITEVANEFKLNRQEALLVAREDMLLSANSIDPKLVDEIKKSLQNIDEFS